MPNQKINEWLKSPMEECESFILNMIDLEVTLCICLCVCVSVCVGGCVCMYLWGCMYVCVCVMCVSIYVFIFYSRTHHDTVAVLIEGTNELSLKTSNLGITPFAMVEVKVEK